MKKSAKHPGFKSVSSSISKKQGISQKSANAILASASRKNANSSSNSHLKRVK